MAVKRFGPNTAEVEALLDRFRRLTPEEWERVAEAAPGVGAIPDLEVAQSPEYFKALEEESWRRVMNACMVAAGALVVRDWMMPRVYQLLWQPMQLDGEPISP